MIVSRARMKDGYTTWHMNTTMPIVMNLFYVDKNESMVYDEDSEIQSLRDEIDILHELVDKILIDG